MDRPISSVEPLWGMERLKESTSSQAHAVLAEICHNSSQVRRQAVGVLDKIQKERRCGQNGSSRLNPNSTPLPKPKRASNAIRGSEKKEREKKKKKRASLGQGQENGNLGRDEVAKPRELRELSMERRMDRSTAPPTPSIELVPPEMRLGVQLSSGKKRKRDSLDSGKRGKEGDEERARRRQRVSLGNARGEGAAVAVPTPRRASRAKEIPVPVPVPVPAPAPAPVPPPETPRMTTVAVPIEPPKLKRPPMGLMRGMPKRKKDVEIWVDSDSDDCVEVIPQTQHLVQVGEERDYLNLVSETWGSIQQYGDCLDGAQHARQSVEADEDDDNNDIEEIEERSKTLSIPRPAATRRRSPERNLAPPRTPQLPAARPVQAVETIHFFVCSNCDGVYAQEYNPAGGCSYHHGYLEVNALSPIWDEWDGRYQGPKLHANTICERPEGFLWTCCELDGTSTTCPRGRHTTEKRLPRLEYKDVVKGYLGNVVQEWSREPWWMERYFKGRKHKTRGSGRRREVARRQAGNGNGNGRLGLDRRRPIVLS
ncbi:hypothetical protein MKZ38_005020 [Zalerion maritima]|uniref:Uncharacterized protein n=1 Tax=Zalerion maritima TaxID=339359 RepID=A0AAD5RLN3_9PEZI|nr:hypothetical protein MKZ38_005020 [Zalerion maritima]